MQPRNQNIKLKQYCGKFKKDFKKIGPHQKEKRNEESVDSQHEAVKAMSGIGGLSAKFFRKRRKKKKGRKKDRWRKEGKEGRTNQFESWLAVEAAAQRTGGSPGLSPGIENPSRQD